MPPVADLHRIGQRGADGLPVGAGPVTGDDLGTGMGAEPVLDDIGGASFQDIDAPAGLSVDEDRRVDEAASQREIVNPQHTGHFQLGKADRQQGPQRRVPGDIDAQRGQQPGPGAAC